jgi:N-acetylglucosaminyl-diphospho-decaprenol L-rhamnosyltransferase
VTGRTTGRAAGRAGTEDEITGADSEAEANRAEAGISVVIVNYEAGPALLSCVEGWMADGAADVVVVDNGSRDGSVARTLSHYPDLEVVRPGRNLGYGAAANRGVAATTTPRIVVSNPDLEVRPGTLGALAAALDDHPGWALVGPLIRTSSGDRYPSARHFPSLVDAGGHALLGIFAPNNRFTRSYQRNELDQATGDPVVVDWVSGACFLVRRSAFEQVGGVDEGYFMYAEDVDLCWRLGQHRWSAAYVPEAEVTHRQGVSTDHHPYRMIVEHHRSLLRFAVRSSRGWHRAALPLVAIGIGIRSGLACLARITGR